MVKILLDENLPAALSRLRHITEFIYQISSQIIPHSLRLYHIIIVIIQVPLCVLISRKYNIKGIVLAIVILVCSQTTRNIIR